MTVQAKLITADELWQMGHGKRIELVQGVIVEMAPTGGEHGEICAWLTHLLFAHVAAHKLGTLTSAETGFVLFTDPDTVRAPDIGFIAASRRVKTKRFYRFAPDLAVEVVSPGDTVAEIEQKALDYLQAGTQTVWVVYPDLRVVAVYRPGEAVSVLRGAEKIDGGKVLPGFAITVDDVFAWIE